MSVRVITSDFVTTAKQLERAATKATTRKIGYATKLAMNAAKRDLKKNTKKRFTGSLKESYNVVRTGDADYAVEVTGSKNLIKWIVHEEGRGPVRGSKERKLYIPLNKTGYNAYVNGSFNGLKWGKDYIFALKSKSARGNKIRYNAINVAKKRFFQRMQLLFGTTRFLRG